ncbi:MAG: hypothetical protein PHU85_07960 [Phycisphaerae bacterium]|nr:hypothetical protein [Phycisphaerae bacterium]
MKRAHWLLLAILGLLSITAMEQSSIFSPRPAAALDNPIEARQETIAELKKVNEKLDRLISIFESGKVKVTVSNAEELRGTAPGVKREAAPVAGPEDDNGSKIVIKRKPVDAQP